MKILGITGGVGSGKSLALSYLKNIEGVVVYEADQIAREIQEKNTQCLESMVSSFGEEILDETGTLNRRRLGEIVFSDSKKLVALNRIIHPLVRQEIERLITSYRKNSTSLFVLEAAILLEGNYDEICDEVWYISRNVDLRMKHLQESRNYTKELFEDIASRQLSEDAFKAGCTKVIDNNGDIEKMHQILEKEVKRLLGEEHENM